MKTNLQQALTLYTTSLLIITTVVTSSIPSEPTTTSTLTPGLPTQKFLKISTQFEHKFTLNIMSSFSQASDITVVVSSCNRLKLLTITLNSFFHFNTYILRELIVIQDCQGDVDKIWEILPYDAQKFQGKYFRVLRNQDRKGQIGSIDEAYKFVNTKYVYHMEDDWAQLGSYGFLQRLKDVLEDCQNKQIKVSQAVLTYPQWSWSHMPGPQLHTAHHTKYYILTSYGKDYLYSFSFNPHLINFQQIYKKILNGSYMTSIARRYHCTNDPSTTVMQNGGCVQHQTGKYLNSVGYKQIYVEIRKESVYKHIGTKEYQMPNILNFQRPIQYQKISRPSPASEKQPKPTSQAQKTPQNPQNPSPLQIDEPDTDTDTSLSKQKKQQKEFLMELFYMFTVSVTIFCCFEGYKQFKKCKKQQKSYQPAVDLVEATTLQLEEQQEN